MHPTISTGHDRVWYVVIKRPVLVPPPPLSQTHTPLISYINPPQTEAYHPSAGEPCVQPLHVVGARRTCRSHQRVGDPGESVPHLRPSPPPHHPTTTTHYSRVCSPADALYGSDCRYYRVPRVHKSNHHKFFKNTHYE